MWNRIENPTDDALNAGPECFENTSVDDYMAHLLGELTPGPDGLHRGWRVWADPKRRRLLCQVNYRTPKRFAANWNAIPAKARLALAGS